MKSLKDSLRSLFINMSVGMYNIENKLIKNSDVENKSGTDGSIEIKKEHKVALLNELNRGEKSIEYVNYFYKLLEKADKVDINKSLLEKYKYNYDSDPNFINEVKDIHGNIVTSEDDENVDYLSKYLNDKNKLDRNRIQSINEHYELVKDLNLIYDYDEYYKTDSSNFSIEPENILSREVRKLLDFVRVRKINSELLLEYWFNNDIILTGNDSIEKINVFKYFYLNKTEKYVTIDFEKIYEVNNNIVAVYRCQKVEDEA